MKDTIVKRIGYHKAFEIELEVQWAKVTDAVRKFVESDFKVDVLKPNNVIITADLDTQFGLGATKDHWVKSHLYINERILMRLAQAGLENLSYLRATTVGEGLPRMTTVVIDFSAIT